jgi:hypothetical protein
MRAESGREMIAFKTNDQVFEWAEGHHLASFLFLADVVMRSASGHVTLRYS